LVKLQRQKYSSSLPRQWRAEHASTPSPSSGYMPPHLRGIDLATRAQQRVRSCRGRRVPLQFGRADNRCWWTRFMNTRQRTRRFRKAERHDALLPRSYVCGPGRICFPDQWLIGLLKSWFIATPFAMQVVAGFEMSLDFQMRLLWP